MILCDKLAILDYLSDGGAALGSVVLDAGGTGAIQRIAFAQSLGVAVSVAAGAAKVRQAPEAGALHAGEIRHGLDCMHKTLRKARGAKRAAARGPGILLSRIVYG